MKTKPIKTNKKAKRQDTHMLEDTLLFEKLVPVILVAFVVITVVLIVFSAGIFLGFIRF